jgi:hypothetical protein
MNKVNAVTKQESSFMKSQETSTPCTEFEAKT